MNEFLSLPVLLNAQAYAWRLALAGVFVCAIALLAARVARRRSDALQYGILLGGVIGLLTVPVLVGFGRLYTIASFAPAIPVEDEVLKVPAEMLPDLLNRPIDDASTKLAEAPSIAESLTGFALCLLWALGVGFGLARLAHGLWKQRHHFVRQSWQPAFWTDALKARLAQQLGMRQFPDVVVSPAAPMPLVLGLWRPVIVLPASSPASWEQPQWEAVLLHEAAHIARRDHWAALAQRLAVTLFWWCPLVYRLSRRLNDLRENICDDYALQGPCDQVAYAELLVESAERLVHWKSVPVSLALLDSAHGGLETRITRLLAKEKRTMTRLSLSGKLLGAVCVGAMCLLTLAATAFSGGAQATPGKKVQIKVIVDGKEIDLNDARLLEYLEAMQKKPQGQGLTFKVIPGPGVIELSKPLTAEIVATQVKDPRIELLVKQAEAIKPGSGAEIRKALQGAPKIRAIAVAPDGKEIIARTIIGKEKATPPGKKVIILQIEDGKVQQLNEADVKKMIEKGIRVELKLDPAGRVTPKVVEEKKNVEYFYRAIPALPGVPATPAKTPEAKSAPTEMEALRRQLERLSADLNALRQQIDAGRKKQ
jgi:beta-lactamase regulating signal transducer with metallopeptidase domain